MLPLIIFIRSDGAYSLYNIKHYFGLFALQKKKVIVLSQELCNSGLLGTYSLGCRGLHEGWRDSTITFGFFFTEKIFILDRQEVYSTDNLPTSRLAHYINCKRRINWKKLWH